MTPTSTPVVGATATPVPATATPAPSATTVTFTSLGSEDGYVASYYANGSSGGYAVASNVYAGDNADAPFRGIVSFDTAALPDNVTITNVELRLVYTQASTGNPWSGMGALVGDVQTGCFASCSLAASDFQAAASVNNAVTLTAANPSGGAGTVVSGLLNSSGRGAVNRTGRTQIKIHFTNLSNANGLSDYLFLAGGEYYLANYRPVLVITYQ